MSSQVPFVGHMLRGVWAERWLRIHSLPGSGRYPLDAADERILLERHLATARRVLGTGEARLWVHTITEGESREPPAPEWAEGLRFAYVATFAEPGECSWNRFATRVPWDEGLLRRVVLEVAHEREHAVSWESAATRGVYCPYDGGADCFFRGREELADAREQLADWLSDRADGL